MKEEPLQNIENPLTSQRTELRKAGNLEMVLPSSRLSPRVANVIETETLRQEADVSETCSFFIADLGQAVMALQEWWERLPDVCPFYGE
jgi:hypothetical protein